MSPDRALSRVGWGFDAHRLDGEPPLKLGGVIVSEMVGVSATSDGDVLAHAVTDALMGACVLGDMGEHFPPDDPGSVDADSMVLLRRTLELAETGGWAVSHVDVTVVCESVKVSPHKAAITRSLAGALKTEPDYISVKATTTDGLGFIGRDEGLAAVAVLTVHRA